MRRRQLSIAALLAAVCAGSFTGCNCGTSTVAPPLPPLSAVTLTPVTDTLVVGQVRLFVAAALDTDSVSVAGATFAWTSSDPAVFTVSSSGLVTARGEGVSMLIAAAGGRADTAVVAVVVQNGWYVQASGTSNDLNAVYFVADGRRGWAVGDAGTVVRTLNAGASWDALASGTSFNLNDVWFTTAQTGFAVGHGGTVMRTRDGGASWTRLANVPASDNLFGVCFADTSHGWAVGSNGVILRTANAGVSWSKLNPTALQLNSVSFSDTTQGWAVGEGGVIVGTHEGGRSWYVVQPAITAQSLSAVWRRSNTRAWAGGAQGVHPATTATPDSLQWTLSSFGASNRVAGLQLVDDFTGYAVGSSGPGLVLKTLDGGANWSPQVTNSAQALNGVWFVDALRGWAVGVGGRIVHTAKGGL
jgi:photosystem II stability/assembly factor-like uncharacterized protein